MNKLILLTSSLLVALFGLAGQPARAAESLASKLSGRILIQVESHGKAWYLSPLSKTRAYLGRPNDAFQVMRFFGLGISNADLNKIPLSTSNGAITPIAVKLSGRILLQTQSHGEAWYVNPVNKKRYYLGRPTDALNVMRKLGLGILDRNLSQIPVNPLFPDRVAVQTPAPAPTPASTTTHTTQTLAININSAGFSQRTIKIKVGDTVTWTNQDSVFHSVTPYGTTLAGFGSSVLFTGQAYIYNFRSVGTYNYYCQFHPEMTGTVIVE
jgi:plastocyanin